MSDFLENIDSAFEINFGDEENEIDCPEIRDAFFEFVCSFMKNY